MTQTPIVRQILLDSDTGLLPYLREQLKTESFSNFKAQFGFYLDEYSTQVAENDEKLEIQTILLLTLKLSIVVDSQTQPDEATLHTLEFQELLDRQIILWSQNNKKLLKPISQIKATLSQLSEIPYHGGYLPGFEINSQLILSYSAGSVELSQLTEQTLEQKASLYSPGDRTPISGQYELVNSDGVGVGLEVTSTAGHPFPPTSESGQSYRLVDPTLHKKPNK